MQRPAPYRLVTMTAGAQAMLSSCVELVHALPGRWRYRLRSATPIDWDRLEQELRSALQTSCWHWRLNRRCQSLLLEARNGQSQLQGWQILVAALAACGATAPEPEVVRINVQVVPDRPPLLGRVLQAPANLISLLAASGLLGLALLLGLAGILGLMLPLAPGLPLLLLASLLVETAFLLRRPFTAPAMV